MFNIYNYNIKQIFTYGIIKNFCGKNIKIANMLFDATQTIDCLLEQCIDEYIYGNDYIYLYVDTIDNAILNINYFWMEIVSTKRCISKSLP